LGKEPREQLSFFDPDQPRPLADEQRRNLLALSLVKGLGESSLKALLRRYRDLGMVWHASADELCGVLSTAGLRAPNEVVDQILSRRGVLLDTAMHQLERFEQQGIRLITDLDNDYPAKLRSIKDPPKWLFVHGNVNNLSLPNLVAVVGTRQASPQGIKRALSLSRWLAQNGFGIVSGLAEGIDEVAHQTALDFGVPTIAILGTGISMVFPASTSRIRQQIIEDGGAIVTEYLPKESYTRSRFIRRNRLQAGLAFATVPIEGQANSGTAHTYKYAQDFGRVTFGVTSSSAPSQNGILELLQADKRPILDLDSAADMAKLAKLLKPALTLSPVKPPAKSLFTSVVREFARIVQNHPVTADDLNALKMELDETWGRIDRDS